MSKRFLRALKYVAAFILTCKSKLPLSETRPLIGFFLSHLRSKKNIPRRIRWDAFCILLFRMKWDSFSPGEKLFRKRLIRKYALQAGEVNNIGDWQTVGELPPAPLLSANNTSSVQYYSIGREPFIKVMESHPFTRRIVLLPAYTCVTVMDPFAQNGWEIVSYGVHKDLTVDAEDFLRQYEKHNPAICVFSSFCGRNFSVREKELIAQAHRNGSVVVADITQSIFLDKSDLNIDYYCGSLRKWYPFPDGGFLFSNVHTLQHPPEKDYVIFRNLKGFSMYCCGKYQQTGNPYFKHLGGLFDASGRNHMCCTSVRLHSMSDYSYSVFSKLDKAECQEKRIKNWKYLNDRLCGNTAVVPVLTGCAEPDSAPLCFHVYAGDRKKLSAALARQGITTLLYWPKPKYVADKIAQNEELSYIFDHVLSLPCDQRYDEKDMMRMSDIIEKIAAQL